MSNDTRDKPNSYDETQDTLRRIETLLETAVKELKQIRGIIAKRLDKEAASAK